MLIGIDQTTRIHLDAVLMDLLYSYDDSTIDLKSNPDKVKPKSAFEAVFLGDVIDEISGQCFTVQQNCKGLVPKVDPNNWKKWLTSVDQENRMSLAHFLLKNQVFLSSIIHLDYVTRNHHI